MPNLSKMEGVEPLSPGDITSYMARGTDWYECNSASSDVTVPETWNNCRYFMADVDGVVHLRARKPLSAGGYETADLYCTVKAGMRFEPRHIVTVFTSGTTCTINVGGSQVAGIRLWR
jgi:hypothetical protein